MMPLPKHIENFLHRGLDLAAKVQTKRAGWSAWIFVHPNMKSGLTYSQQLEEWTRTREARGPYDDAIASFTVRYTELSDWHLQPEFEWDMAIAMSQRPVEDWFLSIPDKDTLANFLESRIGHLDALRFPREVNYPQPPTNYTQWKSLADIEDSV